MNESSSVSREVVEIVLKRERNTMKRLLLSGWRINDELFDAMVQARGLTYDGKWNSQHNSLYVNFQQGKELRDALKEVEVVVVGKQQKPFYINGSKDSATGRTDFVATSGDCFILFGKNIKLAGWEEYQAGRRGSCGGYHKKSHLKFPKKILLLIILRS